MDAGQDVGAVFADGVDVASDVEAVLGDVFVVIQLRAIEPPRVR